MFAIETENVNGEKCVFKVVLMSIINIRFTHTVTATLHWPLIWNWKVVSNYESETFYKVVMADDLENNIRINGLIFYL